MSEDRPCYHCGYLMLDCGYKWHPYIGEWVRFWSCAEDSHTQIERVDQSALEMSEGVRKLTERMRQEDSRIQPH